MDSLVVLRIVAVVSALMVGAVVLWLVLAPHLWWLIVVVGFVETIAVLALLRARRTSGRPDGGQPQQGHGETL